MPSSRLGPVWVKDERCYSDCCASPIWDFGTLWNVLWRDLANWSSTWFVWRFAVLGMFEAKGDATFSRIWFDFSEFYWGSWCVFIFSSVYWGIGGLLLIAALKKDALFCLNIWWVDYFVLSFGSRSKFAVDPGIPPGAPDENVCGNCTEGFRKRIVLPMDAAAAAEAAFAFAWLANCFIAFELNAFTFSYGFLRLLNFTHVYWLIWLCVRLFWNSKNTSRAMNTTRLKIIGTKYIYDNS